MLFAFLKHQEPCRNDAKETCSIVFIGSLMYFAFCLVYSNERNAMTAFSITFNISASLKCLPALLAACQVFRLRLKAQGRVKARCQVVNTYTLLMIVGMILCAGGDYWLELDSASSQEKVSDFLQNTLSLPAPLSPFILGLVSFLLGHIAFIAAFYLDGGSSFRWLEGVVLYSFAGGMIYCIVNYGEGVAADDMLKGGVAVYSFVIATMAHKALSLSLDAYPGMESAAYATFGSLSFLVSDSLLAYNQFIAPNQALDGAFGRFLVMSTYYAALALLASSCAGTARWKVGWD